MVSHADEIFDRLWQDYTGQNPDARRLYDLFVAEGEQVLNDHIAFRTFDDPRVGIDVLSRPFTGAGYSEKGSYRFPDKHLFAKHFELDGDPTAPRVFISQLITEEFSGFLKTTVGDIIDQIPPDILGSPELIHSGRSWGIPSFEAYERLRKESEYAAWVYVYGFRANHFTVSINSLKKFGTIRKVNQFLKDNGFMLNDSGGEVKGSPEELLEQSSIRAGIIPMEFAEGTFEIPSCYYEFAMRYPARDGKLYSGFIAKSADRIFESTDFYRKGKSS